MLNKQSRTAWILIGLVLLCCLVLAPIAQAQDYRFNVPENRVHVYLEQDGTVWLVYDITFAPDPGSHPIDVVDIGLPNDTYNVFAIQASINGVLLDRIDDSPYVTPGIAVELGPNTIQPGQVGTLHIEAAVTDLIFQDSKDDEYASFEFAPTWFGSDFVHGATRLEVNFHLPPGVTAEEPRYHDQEFTFAGFEDDRVVYTWIKEDARGDREYVFGASFPKRVLAEGIVKKTPLFNIDLDACCNSPLLWFGLFAAGWGVFSFLGSRVQKKRKMQYLPPSLSVEGVGIKRGLTAVEAAILLEAPLHKVMTMILFGLVKKGAVTVLSEKPLRLKATDPLPPDTKLWYYERRFLSAINPKGHLAEGALRELAIDLIGDVNKKVTGFSRKETQEYYKDIAARAWNQVEAADTPELLGERWGKGLEWTMLEDDWDDRTRRTFRDRPVVVPHWGSYYRPWVVASSPSGSAPMPTPSGGGTSVTLPTLPGATFANTVVTSIENTANTVVGSVEGFASKVTNATNPPPKTSSSSRSGGGCACACACAGCACACAGGGR